ncbi:uncharacterized protein LOC127265401 [Andrographis paniculata]|uniref:uncharacterized protein LOC127265401 n=1 Tax=Andrographis paniculata TaxID=175694 RepID=UPI0021E7D4D5|nr:uncharacterized protein LOC127265401 [Andrographis paniculata]
MPRSSRHKSHKQSKRSSKDYSDSEEDVIKKKDRSSKDDSLTRARRDSTSGEKRKFSSEVPEGAGTKDLAGDGVDEYSSSRRRKEKERTDASDRWSGGGDDRGDSDRNTEKVSHKRDSLKSGSKLKENSSRSESLRVDSKSKSKRHESASDEKKEDSLASVLVEKEEGKSRGESKRRGGSERDSATHKEGKELKDRDQRDKERNGDEDNMCCDPDMNVRNKQKQIGDFSEERQSKRTREIADQTLQDELCVTESEKDAEKTMRRKKEGSGEKEKRYNDSKEGERQLSSKLDSSKDLKYKDNKLKDGVSDDNYLDDGHKDERRRDEKYREDDDKDSKYYDDKYRDGDKSRRRRSDKYRDDGNRDGRRKDEKCREDGEKDSRRKDDRYREGVERESRRSEKYREDGDRDRRRKDGQYYDDGDRELVRRDEKHRDGGDRDERHRDGGEREERHKDGGDRDDRHRGSRYRDDGHRDSRHKEEKYREDVERDNRLKDSKPEDEHDREKRPRDPKYRDERSSRDYSNYKSDYKHAKDDDSAVDHRKFKLSAYDNSPIHDDRPTKYRRTNEKEDHGDNRSQAAKNQRSDTERLSSSGAKIEPTADRTKVQKQDESRCEDHEEKVRHLNPDIDQTSNLLGSDKLSESLEKLGKKDDVHLRELSAERRFRPSPSKVVDKSPSSSIDRKQFNRHDVRRSADFEDSTQRGGVSRDWKEHSGKEGRGSRELNMDVAREEPLQADADTLSSPFVRNRHFSNSFKSSAPPSYRTGLGSPSLSGSAEDEGRGKSNIHHRRTGDSGMGRVHGSPWGGVPGWPSPVPNGFMPFPPHVSFPSVMQPFPAPPMFGVRPTMEFDHSTPYHILDSNRFGGPMGPMGWGHQVDSTGTPLHSWDATNSTFSNETHIHGRSGWDHFRNLPGHQGLHRTEGTEMPYSEKQNDSTRFGEALGDNSDQPALLNQPAENKTVGQLTKSSGKDDNETPLTSLEDRNNLSRNDVRLCRTYLSKLDIAADLVEPELLSECTGLIDMNPIVCDAYEYRVLPIEDGKAKMASQGVVRHSLFAATDDSIFQKSMSMYKRHKEVLFPTEGGEQLKPSSNFIPSSNQEDEDFVHDKTEMKDNMEEHPENSDLQKPDPTGISKEAISSSDLMMESNPDSNLGQQDLDVENPLSAANIEGSDALPDQVKEEAPTDSAACSDEEVKLVDTNCGSILNSDMLPESMMSGSDNLSRIHLSPESAH